MWNILISTVLYSSLVCAHWATHYSFQEGLIYLQLKNDDLVALNFSISGFQGLSGDSLELVNIKQNQRIHLLTSPPQNSSMFVYGDDLYAFTGAVDESLSQYDKCGNGIFQLLKYESASDSWTHAGDNMTFSEVDDVSFYQDSTYFTSTTSSEIYIYGGQCTETGEIVNRLLAFDMNTMLFANISTVTQPQGFYGATSIWAPNPLQLFVIGGKATGGWLNMDQLATWNFQSGWLFQSVTPNGSAAVSSRINALVLPVFGELANNSVLTFNRNYNPSNLLVLGGQSSGGSEAPWAKLLYQDNGWSWQDMDQLLDTSDILGAAVIFNTLVVVNCSSSLNTLNLRLGNSYQLNLYDVNNNFTLVEDLKSNTIGKHETGAGVKSSLTKTTKVLVGTLVPVAALALIFGIGMFLWKRKTTSKDPTNLLEPLDYQLGHYRTRLDQPYSLLGSRPLDLYQNTNDSSSTLEVASIDSWVRKRQEYEATRHRPLVRHSYLASNDTLNTYPETVNDEPVLEIPEPSAVIESSSLKDESWDLLMVQSPLISLLPPDSSPKSAMPVRLGQLKTFLYTQTPPQLPMVRRKSRLDPGFINLGDGVDFSARTESDEESPDENMDVQVLVSSKRKSVLRVMNPDMESRNAGEGVRLRTPSK